MQLQGKLEKFDFSDILQMLCRSAKSGTEPWQWLAAIYPPYCASKAYWVAEAGGSTWPLWVLVGLVTSAVWVGVLQCVFIRAARR